METHSHIQPPPSQEIDQDTLIITEGVGVSFSGRQILENVNLTINRGEIVTLVGLNGSGKSTLAKILLGLLQPGSGRVRRVANLRYGYVPQSTAIDSSMPLTLRRYLSFSGVSDDLRLSDALDEVGLSGRLLNPMARLSGGELHRAMLARALLRQPDVLVLDEPMSGIDVAGQVKLYQLIENIRDSYNCGVLLISHDLHVVMAATDRVICLNHHICCTGKPESVVGEPEFRALFGVEVANQLALYHHHHDHDHGTDGAVVALSNSNVGALSNSDDNDDF